MTTTLLSHGGEVPLPVRRQLLERIAANTTVLGSIIEALLDAARLDGPGRLKIRLDGVPFAADYWVLWVDTDYRTAVVGTPAGRSGWILNREPTIPADRLKAARDILAFNGYDLTQLQTTTQEAP